MLSMLKTPVLLLVFTALLMDLQLSGNVLPLIHSVSQLSPVWYYAQLAVNIAIMAVAWTAVRFLVLFFWFDALGYAQKAIKNLSPALITYLFAKRIIELDAQLSMLSARLVAPLKTISVVFLIMLIALPTLPAGAAQEGGLKGVEYRIKKVQEDIVTLVSDDLSLEVLESFMGSIVSLVKTDPFSFDLLSSIHSDNQNGGLSDAYSDLFEEGLSFQDFSNLSDPNNEEGLYNFMPDSFIGYLSFFLSVLFIFLMFLAAVFRAFVTMAMGVSTGQGKEMIPKLVLTGLSSVISIVGTVPIYKGYNIIGVFLVSCIVTGVGIANFAVVLYFKMVLAGGVAAPQYTAKANEIFAALVDAYTCLEASDRSSNTKSIVYPSGKEHEFVIDFGAKCGSLRIADEAYRVDDSAGIVGSVLNGITTFFSDSYEAVMTSHERSQIQTKLKQDYNKALSILIEDAKAYVQALYASIDAIRAETIAQGGGSYTADDIIEQCQLALKVRRSGDESIPQEIANICGSGTQGESALAQQYLQAKNKFNKNVADAVRAAVNRAEQIYSAAGVEAKSEGNDYLNTMLADNAPIATEVEETSTWQQYRGGWMRYPVYLAASRTYSTSIAEILKMVVVSTPLNLSEMSEAESKDILEAMAISKTFQVRIREYEKALSDPNAYIEGMKNGGSALIEASQELGGLMQMDNDAMNALIRTIASYIMVDEGEHAVVSLTDTGHQILAFVATAGAAKGLLGLDDEEDDDSADLKKQNKSLADKVANGAGAALKRASVMVGALGLAADAIVGASKPYYEFVKNILPNLFIVGLLLAFGLPSLAFYYFMIACLKWVTQTIKCCIFIAATPLKLYNSRGSDVFGEKTAEVVLMCVVVGASPMIIVGSFMAIEYGMTSIINALQVIFYEFSAVQIGSYTAGLGYVIFTVGGLAVIPFVVVLWMYAFPIRIQDAFPTFISINLSDFSPEGHLSTAVGYFQRSRALASSYSTPLGDDKPKKDAEANAETPKTQATPAIQPASENSKQPLSKSSMRVD